jgi:hypothetical protein
MLIGTFNSPIYELHSDLETITQILANNGWKIEGENIIPDPSKYDMKDYPTHNGIPTPAAVIKLQEGKITEIRVGSYNRYISGCIYPEIIQLLGVSQH